LEWGSGEFISFKSAKNPFVARKGTTTGAKADNTLIPLSDFATSDAKLNSWVTAASGAYLCLGNTAADASGQSLSDTAWAIIPKDNDAWAKGCTSEDWSGRGAYYADSHHGGGWVGVKDNGEPKAGTDVTVGLSIKLDKCFEACPKWETLVTESAGKNGELGAGLGQFG